MKTEEMCIGTTLSKKDLKELLNETKETLAIDAKTESCSRRFSAYDLWYLQKRQKTGTSMRRRLM